MNFLFDVVEEAESYDGARVEGDNLKVSFHHEEEDVGPEGERPEEQRDPVSKEEVEDNSKDDEKNERKNKISGKKTEGRDEYTLSVSLYFDKFG